MSLPEPLIHPSAVVPAGTTGDGVRLGAQSCVMPGAVLTEACIIGEQVFVGAGACVGKGASVLARACIGAGALVGDGASVREAAVLAPGVRVGAHARIEPGAVVTRDVPPNAVVQGHPAVIVGYVDAPEFTATAAALGSAGTVTSRVKGVRLHEMREIQDMRGFLCAAELGRELPFAPRRCFFVYSVPNAQVRGEHAHLRCEQFLIAVHGSLRVMADDGYQRQDFRLDRPNLGLHLPAMTWGVQYGYSEDAVLMVLASDPYDPDDYIRDHADFIARVKQGKVASADEEPAP